MSGAAWVIGALSPRDHNVGTRSTVATVMVTIRRRSRADGRDQAIQRSGNRADEAGETIRIERNGQPIGFFVPLPTPKRDRGEVLQSLDRVGEMVGRVLDQTGLDEEDLVEALAPGHRKD